MAGLGIFLIMIYTTGVCVAWGIYGVLFRLGNILF